MNLQRTTFSTSRELEFFTEKELQMQIGHGRDWWPVAVVKELIDNALDACEAADVAPVVEVDLEETGFSVRDNGPGIPPETVARSLDYLLRVSDKAYYVSPTRGQLGNALKVVWAAPFVAHGERGRVDVWSRGVHHRVDVTVDRLAQRPVVERETEDDDGAAGGATVRVFWPDSAGLLTGTEPRVLYNQPPTARVLVEDYAALNPHATFRLAGETFAATAPACAKWKPNAPTSIHWYTADQLRDLIAAYVAAERETGREPRTVRHFISEFKGLSATAKQKQITDGLKGVYLRDLVSDGDVDRVLVDRLLAAMREASTPPKPAALGTIGGAHLRSWAARCTGIEPDSFRYKRRLGTNGLPHVIEVAFGVCVDRPRRVVTGLNWSPTIGQPISELANLLHEARIDSHDPVLLVAHLARPRFEYTDRGKTRVQL